MRKAAIDVGSNSVLLLVAERTDAGWKTVFEDTAVTALGEGTKESGRLSPKGVELTLAALREFFREAKAHGAERVQAAATMAARIATDTADFQRRAADQGTPVAVLSGDDEARLGFSSVANDPIFATYDALTIVDPGGHSTEIVVAERTDVVWRRSFLHSFPIGTLALLGSSLSIETPGPIEILNATEEIDDAFQTQTVPITYSPVVVLGATGTNLVSIREGLAHWQPDIVHGSYLTFEEISRAVGALMPLTNRERSEIPGMEQGRERTLPGGALILERALFALQSEGCYVSVRGWRYALLDEESPT